MRFNEGSLMRMWEKTAVPESWTPAVREAGKPRPSKLPQDARMVVYR